jgi:hypothetical protein
MFSDNIYINYAFIILNTVKIVLLDELNHKKLKIILKIIKLLLLPSYKNEMRHK